MTPAPAVLCTAVNHRVMASVWAWSVAVPGSVIGRPDERKLIERSFIEDGWLRSMLCACVTPATRRVKRLLALLSLPARRETVSPTRTSVVRALFAPGGRLVTPRGDECALPPPAPLCSVVDVIINAARCARDWMR